MPVARPVQAPFEPADVLVPLTEIGERYLASWKLAPAELMPLLVLGVLVLVALTARVPLRGAAQRWVERSLWAAVAGFGLWRVWDLFWLSDDAFISLRYAANLVAGDGLTWNPGERVEGYTNFLWTLGLAAGLALGARGEVCLAVLGLASFVFTLWAVDRLVARVSATERLRVPIAACLMASSYLFVCFGSSGLESLLVAGLAALAVERAVADRPVAAGSAGALATLAHPDHVLVVAAIVAAWLLEPSRRRAALTCLGAAALWIVPWVLWRVAYYGELLPNTFHAKSGGDSYATQGVVYLAATLAGGSFWVLLPFGVGGAFARRHERFGRIVLLLVPLFVLHVVRLGGDFMFGRLLITPLALLLVAAEVGARDLASWRRAAALLPALTLPLLAAPFRLIEPVQKTWHLADERTFYDDPAATRLAARSHYARWGKTLAETLAPHRERALIALQSVGIVGYVSRLRIVDMLGLNDRHVARLPLARRGRPGHERRASPAYLLARGVHLADDGLFPAPYRALAQVQIPGAQFAMARQESWLVDALRRSPGVSFNDHAVFLDGYRPPADRARAECDLWFSELHYFSVRRDLRRHQRLLDQLQAAGHLDAEARAYLDAPGDYRAEPVVTFDEPVPLAGWLRTGAATSEAPSARVPAGQQEVGGATGRFFNTYTESGGDGVTGVAQSPPFRLTGDVLTLLVGGGLDPAGLTVALVVGGERVRVATGCGSELLGLRVWGLAAHRGQDATLELTDSARGGWGHLVVDDVLQWSKR